jgi:predicted TIM-barrel fold metal-dependent hydrolase
VLDQTYVVDAVVHPYNLSPENQNPAAQEQLASVYAAHTLSVDEKHRHYAMNEAEFFSDVPYEALTSSLFLESQVDFAFIHALPNLGFALGDVTPPDRAAACRDANPGRYGMYATVDTPVTDTAIAQLERQVRDYGVNGLKLYPAFFYDGIGEGWRLDGEDFAVPLLEAAYDLGIRTVAVHKALWLPPAPKSAFRLDDVSPVLDRFPDMRFSIVHAGTAFKDQTVELLRRHQNLYATLESLFAYVMTRPDIFAAFVGAAVTAVGSDRLMFGSGSNLSHPRPLLALFDRFEMPAALVEERGFCALTADDKRNILGLNALRMHGLDESTLRAAVTDTFDEQRALGYLPPWSALRAGVTA